MPEKITVYEKPTCKTCRKLNIAEVKDEAELVKLIVENPSILQRPIVEVGDKAILARPIEKAAELLKL